jgi:hypothetical protein
MIAFNLFYALISFDGNLLKTDCKRASFAAKFLECEICARVIYDDVKGGLGKYRSKAFLAFATYHGQLLMIKNELPERMWLNL